MPGINRRRGVLVAQKQTAIGTTAPDTPGTSKFATGKVSGGMRPTRDMNDLALTSNTQARRGRYVQRARGEGTVTILAHPNELGLWLYEAMGAVSTSGSGPYTHTFTMADALPNPMTVWDLVGDDWWRFADTFVQQLTIRGESGENILCELQLLSYNAESRGPNAPTYTLAGDDPRFKYIGTQAKLEADNATPVVVTNAENAELVINRNLELRYGSSLTPTQQIPSRDVDMSVGIVYDAQGNQGWDFLRGAHLGVVSVTGAVTQNLVMGSWDMTFGKHPSSYAGSLRIYSNGADWEYGVERPDSDPAGGPLEMDIAGPVVAPAAGGTEFTAVLQNETASY